MTRAHGTRARYAFGPGPGKTTPCRCGPCTEANRAEAERRNRARLYGTWQPFVDATAARDHLQSLRAAGIGRRRVAALSGLAAQLITKVLQGRERIRPQTEAAILAVQPAEVTLAPSALVDVTGIRRRMQALVAIGWSQAKLAARLGLTQPNFAAALRREHVTAKAARAARALYDELWDVPPRANDQRSRISVNRARNYAAARGWPPPAAWDDGAIDNPDAGPAEGWQRPARLAPAEFAEEAAEVLALEDGDRHLAAARLGMSKPTFDQAYARAQKAS